MDRRTAGVVVQPDALAEQDRCDVQVDLTPVAYSFLQSGLEPHEQQQVVTLWTTGSMVAAPLGLMVGGPLIELAGTSGGLVLSGVLTLLLLPIAALAVLKTQGRVGCSSLGTFSSRFTELVGMPPSTTRRDAARPTTGMPPCVAM